MSNKIVKVAVKIAKDNGNTSLNQQLTDIWSLWLFERTGTDLPIRGYCSRGMQKPRWRIADVNCWSVQSTPLYRPLYTCDLVKCWMKIKCRAKNILYWLLIYGNLLCATHKDESGWWGKKSLKTVRESCNCHGILKFTLHVHKRPALTKT